ncbi:hypothetical protein SY89_03461 [Halolamina pelagica]|uniref:Uncharacterized protein n=1 Tax=Halolamina pelagica TaxID=699431 RepID=A0A0N8HZD8_9EURY|nr:hypothetical protein SY89_03461 [Halolamina pelagica]
MPTVGHLPQQPTVVDVGVLANEVAVEFADASIAELDTRIVVTRLLRFYTSLVQCAIP